MAVYKLNEAEGDYIRIGNNNGSFSEEVNTEVLPILHTGLYSLGLEDFNIESLTDVDPIAIDIAKPIIEDTLKSIIPVKVFNFSMYHPRQYNYSDDEIDFIISGRYSDYEKLEQECLANAEMFDSFLKKNYSSYDGFVSFMPSNIDEFNEEKTFWKKLCQVIMFYIPKSDVDENTSNYQEDLIYALYENFDLDDEEDY